MRKILHLRAVRGVISQYARGGAAASSSVLVGQMLERLDQALLASVIAATAEGKLLAMLQAKKLYLALKTQVFMFDLSGTLAEAMDEIIGKDVLERVYSPANQERLEKVIQMEFMGASSDDSMVEVLSRTAVHLAVVDKGHHRALAQAMQSLAGKICLGHELAKFDYGLHQSQLIDALAGLIHTRPSWRRSSVAVRVLNQLMSQLAAVAGITVRVTFESYADMKKPKPAPRGQLAAASLVVNRSRSMEEGSIARAVTEKALPRQSPRGL